MPSKITPEKWQELEQTARLILEGKASPLRFKRRPQTHLVIYGQQKLNAIMADLENTNLTAKEIAVQHRVPIGLVDKQSIQRSNKIEGRKRASGKTFRDPKRKTGFFSESQIEAWVLRFEPRMRREAKNLWKNGRVQAIMPSPEEIADFLKDRLRWYLEIFLPDKKIIGKTLDEKIARYCNSHISFGVKDIFERIGTNKVRWQRSLFEKSGKIHGRQSTLLESLKGKTDHADFNAQQILDVLRAKGLVQSQRAIVLAKVAGMPNPAISRALGITVESLKKRYFLPIRQEHGIQLTNPIRSATVRRSWQRRMK